MLSKHNELLSRVYLVLLVFVVLACFILGRAVQTSVIEGDKWRARGDSLYLKYIPIEAARGNIYSDNGSLMATSLPFFEIRMDLKCPGLTNEVFEAKVDSLALCLSKYVNPDRSHREYGKLLRAQRAKGNRYLLIAKNVSYPELETIKDFPIFRRGQYKGGFIALRQNKRNKPFGMLASRSIGYIKEDGPSVGLESFFNDYLKGKDGLKLMERLGGGTYVPVANQDAKEPERGNDILTTININIQDISQQALCNALKHHKADEGTVIVMEVETGAIKAISNVKRTASGFAESYNYAVGNSSEPGSTFKLASAMALLEDGHVTLDSKVNLHKGRYKFYDRSMKDSRNHGIEWTNFKEAFAISSNVGIAQLVKKHYDGKQGAEKFINRLKAFHLNDLTDIEIKGETKPYIKEANNLKQRWSGTTLPWMATGYELKLTPLQVLAFYNAIANNGTLMKPYLVEEIKNEEGIIKKIKPKVIDHQLASKQTIREAKKLLYEAVETGTGKYLKTDKYSFAGKTGTARIDYQKERNKGSKVYQASFAGFFPADNPKYSIMVCIYNPTENGYYGSNVAGPVFREIADKCFASLKDLSPPINLEESSLAGNTMPGLSSGYKEDFKTVMASLSFDYDEKSENDWVVMQPMERDKVKLETRKIDQQTVPNVIGMGLRDAVYLLENSGLHVRIKGFGKIIRQSLEAGTPIHGQSIDLTLE
ncbi:MAG: penicillin-binding protein [Bacteroidota bacterium]